MNLPNIMLQVSIQSIVRRNSDSDSQGIISLGSVTMLHVSSCLISCFTFLCKLCQSKFRHWSNGKLGLPSVFRPPRGWETHDLKTLQVQGTYSQHIRAWMFLPFAVQFCTNSFSNSSFCRNSTWGCFKIRDTQMVNRSSQPLDLGAQKFCDAPGKRCLTTSPSYWDQFLSGLFARYKSTNQPAKHQWTIHLEDQIEVSDLHHLMYANFIPTRWAPDPVRNGVIALTNGFINGVAGVVSPLNQWSDMGPYLQLVTGPNFACSVTTPGRRILGIWLLLFSIFSDTAVAVSPCLACFFVEQKTSQVW